MAETEVVQRGKPASKATVATRKLLNKHPELTWATAKPLLEKQGFAEDGEGEKKIGADQFAQVKHLWKKSQEEPAAKQPKAKAGESKKKGKPASKKTVAIRKLLDKYDGKKTYSEARPILEKQGFSEDAKDDEMKISENKFNVVKNGWLAQHGKVGTRGKKRNAAAAPVVRKTHRHKASDNGDALSTVQSAGGVASLKAQIEAKRAEIEEAEAEVAKMEAAVAEFEALLVS